MRPKAKLSNPLTIKITKNGCVLLADESYTNDYNLDEKGVLIGGEHYGFILIKNLKGKQYEQKYLTECRINGINLAQEKLKIYEEGKTNYWLFTKSGDLEYAPNDVEINDEITQKDYFMANPEMFLDKPILLNPIKIKISKIDPTKNALIKDELVHEDYPLNPGVVLGEEHYGFILVFEKDGKEVSYPTYNPIYGISSNWIDIQIYEKGKYNPWVFSVNGKLEKKSSYNLLSRNDLLYIKDRYKVDEDFPENADALVNKR